MSEPKEPRLKPCPFCGVTPQIARPWGMYRVVCIKESCPTNPETGKFATEDEAIAAWNRRKP